MIPISKHRNHGLDNLKAIMIIGIVFEHSLLIYGYPRQHEIIWALMISWLMPLFTMISGFCFKVRTIKDLCYKYLRPLLLFSAINFIVGYFFYPPYHIGIHIIGYAMWYLWALFIFALATPRVLKYFNKTFLLILSIFFSFIYQLLPLNDETNKLLVLFQINRIVGFYPFFLMGIIIKEKEDYLLKRTNRRIWYYILLFVTLLYIILCTQIIGLSYNSAFYLRTSSDLNTLAKILLSYIVILIICVSLIFSVPQKIYWYTKYGGRTLNVYLLHMIVVFPICYGIFSILPYSLFFVILNSICACSICLFLFSNFTDILIKKLLSINWIKCLIIYVLSFLLVNYTFFTTIVR